MSKPMPNNPGGNFRIGDWIVDPAAGVIFPSAAETASPVSLRPREMDLLVYLAGRPGEVVTAEELLEAVWTGVVVGTDSVYFSISQLRKALGDSPQAPRCIETIPKRGYRLIARVAPLGGEAVPTAAGLEPGHQSAAHFVEHPGKTPPGARRPATRKAIAAALAAVVLLTSWLGWHQQAPDARHQPGPTIAVMPFIDLSAGQDQGYFSEGIAEELLNRLARVPGLTVASRTSSFAFKGDDPSIQEIGEQLAVANVLEGSVRRDADRVRIAAQLVDASTGFQIWSDSYDLPLADILTVQEQISRALAAALELQLLVPAPTASTAQPVDPRAYDHYLQGLRAVQINTFDALEEAADHFEQVISIDPAYPDAYAALAFTLQVLHATGANPGDDTLERARQLASEALDLDSTTARAHVVLGHIDYKAGRQEPAIDHYRNAVRHAPGNSEVLVELAKALSHDGQADEASGLFQQALRNDPLNARVQSAYGMYLEKVGLLDQALASYQRAAALNPRDPNLRWFEARIRDEQGDAPGAIESLEIAARLDPSDYEIAAFVSLAYANMSLPEEATLWATRATGLESDSGITRAALAVSAALDGRQDSSLDIARRTLADQSTRYSHGARQILTTIAVSELLRGDEPETAERLLLGNPDLVDYLATEPATTLTAFLQCHVSPGELIALAEVYRRLGRARDVSSVVEHLRGIRLAATSTFREHHRAMDYLIEAQIEALSGNSALALDHLDHAVALGYRSGWALDGLNAIAFTRLQENPRYQALLAELASRLRLAQSRLQQNQLAASQLGS